MSSTSSTLPYIGSKISLISNSDIRYEGVLYTINTQESTVALQDVRSYGTEGRRFPDIPGSTEVFDFIIFRGKDIKDLTVCEPIKSSPSIHDDPAIVSMNVAPPISSKIDSNNTLNNSNNATANNTVNENAPSHERGQINNRNDRVYSNQGGTNFHNRSGNTHNNAGMGGGRLGGGGGGGQTGHGNNNMGGGGGYNRTGMMQTGHRGGYGNGGNRLYGGGGGAYRGTRHVIGELPAQPNQNIKSEMSCDFDFDEANAKFEKPGTNGVPPIELNAGNGTEFAPPPLGGYDKKSSFFDNISCETLDRQQGREEKLNREKQRALDTETFGLIATQHRTFRPGGYRRGGRGGRGGYGYGRGGYGARGIYNTNYGNNLGGGYGGRYPGY